MNEIFKMFLSLSGSLLILLLLSSRPLVRNRIGKGWQYYIWLIVIARLLLPISPQVSPVGALFQEADRAFGQADALMPEQNPKSPAQPENAAGPGSDAALEDGGALPDKEPPAVTRPMGRGQNFVVRNLWLIWLVAALLLLIRKITIYQDFVKYIRAGRQPVSDTALLDRLAETGDKAGVKRPVELYTNNLISSPLLLGFFRPCIVLPTADLPEADLQYTLLHELTHYKRKDMFYKWLVQITVCLHWFNPLVYLMSHEINRMCELACDEAVIRKLDTNGQQAYGDTLISAIGMGGSYKDRLASVTLSESKELLKERLGEIMKYKKKSRIVIGIALMGTVTFAVLAAATGAYAMSDKPADSSIAASDKAAPVRNDAATAQQRSGILPDGVEELAVSIDIDMGGLEILPASANEITAIYDKEYYDVQITDQEGGWAVTAVGKQAKMSDTDPVKLYIPDTKRNLEVHVESGNFFYNLPENCRDEINITAANGGVWFSSDNGYADGSISLTAQDKDFIRYEKLIYPDYFTPTGNGFVYQDGGEKYKIDICLTSYTHVDFVEGASKQ